MAWIALTILAVGTAGQLAASQDAAAAARAQAAANQEAIAAQERAANVQAQRERIRQQREARIARARVIASATSSGIGVGTSGVAGVTGSITSQETSNIGAINVAQSFSQTASEANKRAASASADIAGAQAIAAQWQALSNIGGSIFQSQGGWQNIFGGASVKPAQAQGSISPDEFMNPTNRIIG